MENKDQVIEKRPDGSLNVKTVNTEKTKTQQQYKKECDINEIMKKYQNTGVAPEMRQQGAYMDLTQYTNYHDMLNKVAKIEEVFDTLPAKTRAEFKNDPARLIEFLNDDKNYEKAIELELIFPKKGDTNYNDDQHHPDNSTKPNYPTKTSVKNDDLTTNITESKK